MTCNNTDNLEFTIANRLWTNSSFNENETYDGLLLSGDCSADYHAPPPLELTLMNPDVQCLSNHYSSSMLWWM